MAFIVGVTANQAWQKFQKQEITVIPKLVFTHHLNNPAELDKLQRRGENGQELSFLPNDPIPFSGYAANSYGNGQHQLLIQFIKGKTMSAKGWHLNGEPSESTVKNGTGFIMETDDPEVGFFYENGFEIAYRGKRTTATCIVKALKMDRMLPTTQMEIKKSTPFMLMENEAALGRPGIVMVLSSCKSTISKEKQRARLGSGMTILNLRRLYL